MDGSGQSDGRSGSVHVGEAELQRSSGEFLEHVDEMRALEMEKRELPPEDGRRPELAVRIEAMAMDLFGRSQYQTRLTTAQAEPVAAPIRPLHTVLADWRDADRRLRAAHEVARSIAAEGKSFQDEYHRNLELGHSDPTA